MPTPLRQYLPIALGGKAPTPPPTPPPTYSHNEATGTTVTENKVNTDGTIVPLPETAVQLRKALRSVPFAQLLDSMSDDSLRTLGSTGGITLLKVEVAKRNLKMNWHPALQDPKTESATLKRPRDDGTIKTEPAARPAKPRHLIVVSYDANLYTDQVRRFERDAGVTFNGYERESETLLDNCKKETTPDRVHERFMADLKVFQLRTGGTKGHFLTWLTHVTGYVAIVNEKGGLTTHQFKELANEAKKQMKSLQNSKRPKVPYTIEMVQESTE